MPTTTTTTPTRPPRPPAGGGDGPVIIPTTKPYNPYPPVTAEVGLDDVVVPLRNGAENLSRAGAAVVVVILGIAVLFKGIPVLWGIAKQWLGKIGK